MYRTNWLPEIFNDFFTTGELSNSRVNAPAINVLESDADYVVELAAPGMQRDDFDVNINSDGDLTIKMECKRQKDTEPVHYLRRDFCYKNYNQMLILPDDVDREKIAANVENGVLTVTLPKLSHEAQKFSRSITIG